MTKSDIEFLGDEFTELQYGSSNWFNRRLRATRWRVKLKIAEAVHQALVIKACFG
jgi:hypothetical protein